MKNKSLIWNPFTRIAGWQAFGIGIVIVVVSAVIAGFGNLLFDGAIDAHFGDDVGVVKSLVVNGISLISVVLVMYITGLIISRDFRFVDILGTMTLARAPLLILALIALFVSSPSEAKVLENPMIVLNYPSLIIFGLISIPIIVWFVALMYNGLKVSTGAKGKKLVIGFIGGLLFAEIISKMLIHLIL
ncbi:MAG: hypothetical protein GX361_05980 [Bacteroidales bacterium]|nr:hypothetical protein [Bacteroidales bacterium]